jgi:hypothetical protein
MGGAPGEVVRKLLEKKTRGGGERHGGDRNASPLAPSRPLGLSPGGMKKFFVPPRPG